MTSRQWRLYNYLKKCAEENSDRFITQEEICEVLNEDYSLNHKAMNKMCCSYIQSDVLYINSSLEVDKIILFKHQTYKIAKDYDEAIDFLNKKFLKKIKKLGSRYTAIKKKIYQDGQGKILSNRGEVIDGKSKAREYRETYINTEREISNS